MQGNGNTNVLMYLHNLKMKISLCILSRCYRKRIVSIKNDEDAFMRDVKGQCQGIKCDGVL